MSIRAQVEPRIFGVLSLAQLVALAAMASWEVVSPHISNSMEQSSRPKVGFHSSDIHAANGGSKEKMVLARPRDMGTL